MQQFLYYGGLENADYNPMFKKQGGGALDWDPERALPKMRLQPFWGDDRPPFMKQRLGLRKLLGQGKKSRRKKRKQRGGQPPGGAHIPVPKDVVPAPRRAPVRAPVRAPPASLWDRAKGFVKDNRLLSRGLEELSSLAGKYKNFQKYQPYLHGAKTLAELKGWGKKKRGKK